MKTMCWKLISYIVIIVFSVQGVVCSWPADTLAPQSGFQRKSLPVSEIKTWHWERIRDAESELVARFGYKGWNLLLAHALSGEIGGFSVPEFEIIEIDELWKPFYEANREAIDKIIKINRVKEAFKKALEDVYRKYKTREERRGEFRRKFDEELADLKDLFSVNNMDEFEEKLERDPIARSFSSDVPDFPVSRVTIQLLYMMQGEIAERLDFNCIAPVLEKYRKFIRKKQNIYCRTSATDEDTKENAKAGKYRSGSVLWKDQDIGIEYLKGIIISDLYALGSGDVSCAFILQDALYGDDLEGGVVFSELNGGSVVELGYGKKNPLVAATKGDKSIIIRIADGKVKEVLYNNVNHDDMGLNHSVKTKDGSEHKITIEKKVLERIVKIAKEIEKRLGYAVDIEFGVRGGEIFIVQIRPVTVNPIQPLPEFRQEDIIAEFPVSINKGSANGVKVVFMEGFANLYDIQETIGYDKELLFCDEGRVNPDMMPRYLFGDKIFWAGKSICKIAHSAINERQEGRDVIMGYFGDMQELKQKLGGMKEIQRDVFITEEIFDIYSNGDKAVLVRAGAVPARCSDAGIEEGSSFKIDGMDLFPLIAPTAVTHQLGEDQCIRTLGPEQGSDLVIESSTQVFIFLPGDIDELRKHLKLEDVERLLQEARFGARAGICTLGAGGDLSTVPENLRIPLLELTQKKLSDLKLNETRDFMLWVNTSRCQTAEDAILMAGLGISFGKTPYLKLEIRGPDLMTRNDEVVSAIERLINLNENIKIIPLVGKDIDKDKLRWLLGRKQIVGLRLEGTKPGSNQGLGDELEKEQLRQIIKLVKSERPDISLIAECGIGTAEQAKVALEMGFSAVLVNAAITQSADPVKTAAEFARVVREFYEKRIKAGAVPVGCDNGGIEESA